MLRLNEAKRNIDIDKLIELITNKKTEYLISETKNYRIFISSLEKLFDLYIYSLTTVERSKPNITVKFDFLNEIKSILKKPYDAKKKTILILNEFNVYENTNQNTSKIIDINVLLLIIREYKKKYEDFNELNKFINNLKNFFELYNGIIEHSNKIKTTTFEFLVKIKNILDIQDLNEEEKAKQILQEFSNYKEGRISIDIDNFINMITQYKNLYLENTDSNKDSEFVVGLTEVFKLYDTIEPSISDEETTKKLYFISSIRAILRGSSSEGNKAIAIANLFRIYEGVPMIKVMTIDDFIKVIIDYKNEYQKDKNIQKFIDMLNIFYQRFTYDESSTDTKKNNLLSNIRSILRKQSDYKTIALLILKEISEYEPETVSIKEYRNIEEIDEGITLLLENVSNDNTENINIGLLEILIESVNKLISFKSANTTKSFSFTSSSINTSWLVIDLELLLNLIKFINSLNEPIENPIDYVNEFYVNNNRTEFISNQIKSKLTKDFYINILRKAIEFLNRYLNDKFNLNLDNINIDNLTNEEGLFEELNKYLKFLELNKSKDDSLNETIKKIKKFIRLYIDKKILNLEEQPKQGYLSKFFSAKKKVDNPETILDNIKKIRKIESLDFSYIKDINRAEIDNIKKLYLNKVNSSNIEEVINELDRTYKSKFIHEDYDSFIQELRTKSSSSNGGKKIRKKSKRILKKYL